MSLDDAVLTYLLHIRVEKGLSRKTRFGSAAWIHRFQRWLAASGYAHAVIDVFCEPVLRRFLLHLTDLKLRPRTIHGAFYPLRMLGDFLVERKLATDNPVRRITLPKKDAAVRKVTSDEEIQKLMAASERLPNLQEVVMARALLAVLVFAGLRRQELLDLRVGDIDLDDRSILVRAGKGSKSRKVFVCRECHAALKEWIVLRPECEHDYLWVRNARHRAAHGILRNLIRNLKAIAGLASANHIQPHSLRHAAATRLLRNGANLRDIQCFLGHSNITTTSIYLHSDEESLRKAAELGSLSAAPPLVDQINTARRLTNDRWRRVSVARGRA